MKAEIRARMLPIVLLVGAASAFSGVPIAMANRQVTPTNKTTCSGGLIETVEAAYMHNAAVGRTTWEAVRDLRNQSWAGLLPDTTNAEGLDTFLRAELIKYGELTQATYDGFNSNKTSDMCGKAYWDHANFLQKVGAASWTKIPERYEIVSEDDYIYASASLYDNQLFKSVEDAETLEKKRVWIGYIAITTDKEMEKDPARGKDIVVAFRGTILGAEWGVDGQIFDKDYSTVLANFNWTARVNATRETKPHVFRMHTGFYKMYTTRTQKAPSPQIAVRDRLKKLVEANKGAVRSITFVGHSLGGALAAVSAADIGVMRKYDFFFDKPEWKDISLNAYTFAAPRVADAKFRTMLRESINVRLLNVIHKGDVVPCVPAGIKGLGLLPDWADFAAPYLHTLGAGIGSRWPSTYWNSVALADKAEGLWMYTDSGDKLFLDSRQSSDYIRPLGRLEFSPLHNLEGYLFMLAKQHTSAENPAFFRDVALLNKSDRLLREDIAAEEKIPPKWYKPLTQSLTSRLGDSGNVIWR